MKKAVSLNGKWRLAESRAPNRAPRDGWVDAEVPGDVNDALSVAGVLPKDLFYRENIKEAKWIEQRYWWYETEFEHTELSSNKLELIFNGLDLFATVYLNGKKLGETDNAFRQFRFDVTADVVVGMNRLQVEFAPTLKTVEKLHEEYPEYWSLFTPGRSLVRHAQCQFGWDWAPSQMACGIWEDVFLEESDNCAIVDLFVESQLDGDCCVRVRLAAGEEAPIYCQGELSAEIRDADGIVARETLAVSGVNNFICIKVENPKWWWPNGMGSPDLYECTVELRDQDGGVADRRTVVFGFRSVEIEEKIVEKDRIGFTFKVNGERVFCKGANWVPAHCFPGVTRADTYEYLVRRAQEANYNILRIWGGGIYEKKWFYEECDRRGIMIWQDFANACAEPPDDQEHFLDNIISEAEYQVRRLRNHPAIICWCGGNESSASHHYQPDRPGQRLAHFYYRGVVGDLSPHTPYIYSSPHSRSDFGQVQTSGETHWSTWPRSADVTYGSFRERIKDIRTVFNGEICLQGPSPLSSQLQFLDKSDIWPPNDVMDFHVMCHPAAKQVHPRYVISQLKAAEQIIGPCDNAESFTNNAMMAHAEMVREELGFYRATKWNSSGAMLWMFNECWPCSNWATVDFYGAMKPSYWIQKILFAPLAVTIKRVHDNFTLHLMNDTLQDVSGSVHVRCMDIFGNLFWEEQFEADCSANEAVQVKSYAPSRVKGKNVFLRMEWIVDGRIFSENYFPQLFKDVDFEQPRLSWEINGSQLEISSENYARFVHVDIPVEQARDVTLSDNYFDLIPGETRIIQVQGSVPLADVQVHSLFCPAGNSVSA